MKQLAEQIKKALEALAYADMGERIGRHAMYEALNGPHQPQSQPATPKGAAQPTPPTSPRYIALSLTNSISEPVLSYAIGACRRMQAGLLLLSSDAGQVRQLLQPHLQALQGIECVTEELPNHSVSALSQALHLHRGVLFAVSGGSDDPMRRLAHQRRGQPQPPVPIVLVGNKPPSQREGKEPAQRRLV